jgi:hypothetical protein
MMPMLEWHWPLSIQGDRWPHGLQLGGTGVVVGDWGVRGEVEATGAGVGDANVTR